METRSFRKKEGQYLIDRIIEQKEKEAAEKANEKKKVSSKEARLLSGRALFVYNPSLFVDDEGAADTNEYEVVDPEEEERNVLEGKEEEVNIAEAAERAAAEKEAAGITEPDEEVKISLTMFEDEDLGDLPSDEDEDEDEKNESNEKEENENKTTNETKSTSEQVSEPS